MLMTTRKRARGYLPLMGVITLFVLLMRNGEVAMEGVKRGISLCANTLFPSLYPYLVLSELLVTLEAGELPGRWLKKPFQLLFGLSGSGAAAFLLGTLCGFPTGTATAVALYRKKALTKEEVGRLFLFVNNPSPGFLIGVVGGAMLGNAAAGAVLFGITTLSAVAVGIFFRFLKAPLPKSVPAPETGRDRRQYGDVVGCIKRGFNTMLQVTALVLFFSTVTACLLHLSETLAVPKAVSVFLIGVLEMTSGTHAAVAAFSPQTAFLLAAFFAGFSGLSVCLQLLAVSEGFPQPIGAYLGAKIVQGGLCVLLTALYVKLFRPAFRISENAFYPVAQSRMLPCRWWFWGIFCVFLLVVALSEAGKRKK